LPGSGRAVDETREPLATVGLCFDDPAVDNKDYADAGPITALRPEHARLLDRLPNDAAAICAAVQGLVIQPDDAAGAGVPEDRLAEKHIRPASRLLDVVLAHDRAPLSRAREPAARVVGTCRHFAVLSVALLRAKGIPARARCGFATYFQPGLALDHWIAEYWWDRWVRIDSEILGGSLVARPDDLAPGEFLTGGEAWLRYRQGADAAIFGVSGTTHAWGVGEIRGNAIRDLAALCKVEMLPWDEWGRMTDSYAGRTGDRYDRLMDRIAEVSTTHDAGAIRALYADEDLTVPAAMLVLPS
jgi:hypothetical protein